MIIDRYIKMIRYISICKNLTAVELAEIFFEQIAFKYDVVNPVRAESRIRAVDVVRRLFTLFMKRIKRTLLFILFIKRIKRTLLFTLFMKRTERI